MKSIYPIFMLAILGCQAHIQLPKAPSRDAPFEERVEAYQKLRPVVETSHYLDYSYAGRSLTLGNGKIIHDAKDLLPVVGSNTQFVNYVERAKDQDKKALYFYLGALGGILVGTTMLIADVSSDSGGSISKRTAEPLGWAGLSTLGLGAVSSFIGYLFSASALKENDNALGIYEKALEERLGIKRQTTNLIDAK